MLARRAKCLRPSCHWPTLLPKYSKKGFEHNLAACFQVRALDPRAMHAEGMGEVCVSVGTAGGRGVSASDTTCFSETSPSHPPPLCALLRDLGILVTLNLLQQPHQGSQTPPAIPPRGIFQSLYSKQDINQNTFLFQRHQSDMKSFKVASQMLFFADG